MTVLELVLKFWRCKVVGSRWKVECKKLLFRKVSTIVIKFYMVLTFLTDEQNCLCLYQVIILLFNFLAVL